MNNSAKAILLLLGLLAGSAEAVTVTYSASGNWTAPAGVTSVTVEAWGGGGGGGAGTGNPAQGGGGAGGQYVSTVVAVTPGNTYAYVVGAAGTGGNTVAGGTGGDSTFAATTVVAKGGAGGGLAAANSSGGTAGLGSTAGGVGNVVYAGGAGAAGTSTCAGGAGGGGAGSAGAGGNASGNTAGSGTATGGGAGATETTAQGAGSAGNVAGGGGGGGCAKSNTNQNGGNGAAGQITITYIGAPTVTSNAATSLISTGATLNGTVSSNGATTTVAFNYGLTTAYGSSATAAQSPLAANAANTAVSAAVTGLTCGTTYHFRVNGTNSAGTTNGSDLTFTTPACVPSVTTLAASSILAKGATLNGTVSSNGASTTVTFDYGLTTGYGSTVTATGSPLAAGASGTAVSAAVTGLTCGGTTYHFRVKGVNSAGTTNGGDLTFTTSTCPVFCTPPANTPPTVSVTCQCDTFARATLNPSTIFGADWKVSSSDTTLIPPSIVNSGYLRLTNNTASNAKAATVPGIFPAAGNYISVEFQQYAYNGSGADGIAVTLSDYAVPAVPGAFGGSLGFAQKSNPGSDCATAGGCPGFAGGWIGVAMDEYGNYSAATEGRVLGPGATAQSVGVRGPGSAQNGYRWMGGSLAVGNIDNSASATAAPGNMYQVIVDARNSATNQILVYVNRDTTTQDGTNYTNVFGGGGGFNAYTEANYALGQGWISSLIPANWQISFTGSTGGANNIHEISSLRICAQTFLPPTGGTASGFSAIDEAYPVIASGIPAFQNFQTGHVFTKLIGAANTFKLWVAALNSAGTGISSNYSVANAKYAQVNIVDNSDNACGPDSARTCNSACTGKSAAEAGATQIVTFAKGGPGASLSPAYTLNSSWQNLIAVMKECTTSACTAFTSTAPACSVDSFSVRPLSIASVTSFDAPAGAGNGATNTGSSGSPIFKAGSGNFVLSAYTTGVANSPSGYTGVMKINNAVIASSATYAGVVTGSFPAATSATPATATAPASTATGKTFTYSEVGGFTLPGYPLTDTTSRRGVYDGVATADECTTPGLTPAQCDALRAATWTGIDSISTKGDCVLDSYSNTKDASGKYGCNFGLVTTTAVIGRFVPDHFAVSANSIVNRADYGITGSVSAGTGALTLSSAAGVKVNDVISIAGAGVAGGILTTTAASVSADGLTVTLAINATTTVSNSPVNVVAFTYMGEQMNALFTLTAQSAGNTTTKNYAGATWAKLDPTIAGVLNLGAIDNPGLPGVRVPMTARISTTGLPAVTGKFLTTCTPSPACLGTANVIAPLMISRGASGDGPYSALDVGIAPMDSDGVTTIYDLDTVNVVAGANNHTKVGRTEERYGRIKVSNAYGSELLPLSLSATAQYYTASGWVNSITDNQTNLTLAAIYSLLDKNGNPTGSTTSASRSPASGMLAGQLTIKLAKPTGGATVTGIATISPTAPGYLQPIIPGTATFGVYKSSNSFIDRRESY